MKWQWTYGTTLAIVMVQPFPRMSIFRAGFQASSHKCTTGLLNLVLELAIVTLVFNLMDASSYSLTKFLLLALF